MAETVKESVISNLLRIKEMGCKEEFILLERLFSTVQKLERDIHKFEGSSSYENFIEDMFWHIYCCCWSRDRKDIFDLYEIWCSNLVEDVNLNKNLQRYTPRF